MVYRSECSECQRSLTVGVVTHATEDPARVLLRPLPNHRHASRVGPPPGGSSLADGCRVPPPSSPSRILFIYSETRGGCFRIVSRGLAPTENILSALSAVGVLCSEDEVQNRVPGPSGSPEQGTGLLLQGGCCRAPRGTIIAWPLAS